MPLDATQFANVVQIYQSNIDSLISVMGKEVTLVFPDTVTNVKSDYDDPLRHDVSRKPDFKNTSIDPIPIRTPNTKTIKALTKDDPKEFKDFNIRVDNAQAIVRLKTMLTDVPDLRRCSYIIVHSKIKDILEAKFRLIREPVPTGLQEDRYAISYWIHI
jgi:hypothetical protein